MSKSDKPKRGRPTLDGNEALMPPITIRLSPEIMRRINKIRAERMDRPAKSVIVRELVAKALGS